MTSFQPTSETWTPRARSASSPRAGAVPRAAADTIDFVVLIFLWAIVSTIIHLQSEIIFFFVGLIYFTLLEARGQTVGKVLMHIRVASIEDGEPIGYRRALIRDLSRILSWIPFCLGYLWMFWSPEKQTWHDKLSHAVVVPLTSQQYD